MVVADVVVIVVVAAVADVVVIVIPTITIHYSSDANNINNDIDNNSYIINNNDNINNDIDNNANNMPTMTATLSITMVVVKMIAAMTAPRLM